MFASSPERGSFLRGVLALSVKPCRACQLSQRESPWQCGKVSGSSAKFAGVSAPLFSREGAWNELPQAKPIGFASSLPEGAFGMAVQFPVEPQSLQAGTLPFGELARSD